MDKDRGESLFIYRALQHTHFEERAVIIGNRVSGGIFTLINECVSANRIIPRQLQRLTRTCWFILVNAAGLITPGKTPLLFISSFVNLFLLSSSRAGLLSKILSRNRVEQRNLSGMFTDRQQLFDAASPILNELFRAVCVIIEVIRISILAS